MYYTRTTVFGDYGYKVNVGFCTCARLSRVRLLATSTARSRGPPAMNALSSTGSSGTLRGKSPLRRRVTMLCAEKALLYPYKALLYTHDVRCDWIVEQSNQT